jgi:hypothetical protein
MQNTIFKEMLKLHTLYLAAPLNLPKSASGRTPFKLYPAYSFHAEFY